eukprot:353716-Chlamydomonas_euryale.AAC.13
MVAEETTGPSSESRHGAVQGGRGKHRDAGGTQQGCVSGAGLTTTPPQPLPGKNEILGRKEKAGAVKVEACGQARHLKRHSCTGTTRLATLREGPIGVVAKIVRAAAALVAPGPHSKRCQRPSAGTASSRAYQLTRPCTEKGSS